MKLKDYPHWLKTDVKLRSTLIMITVFLTLYGISYFDNFLSENSRSLFYFTMISFAFHLVQIKRIRDGEEKK